MKRDFLDRINCEYDYKNVTEIITYPSGTETCGTAAFLLWIGLLVASSGVVVFAMVVSFIAHGMMRKGGQRLSRMRRIFVTLLALIIIGMYFAANVAGASLGLSSLILYMCSMAALMLGFTVLAAFGTSSLKQKFQNMPMIRKIETAWWGDYAKAFFVLLLPVYSSHWSIIHQPHQKVLHHAQEISEDEKHPTSLGLCSAIEIHASWKWSSVLLKLLSRILCRSFKVR